MFRMMSLLALALGTILNAQDGYAAGQADQFLQVLEDQRTFRLSVPVSRLVMSLPKGSFVRANNTAGGSAESPRYFYFEDRGRGFIISGWFEPATAYHGIEEFWKSETFAWRMKNFPEPKSVKFEELSGWSAITYGIAFHGATSSHVRAHYIKAGTWIDIHLSITSHKSYSEDIAFLTAYLKSVAVTERE